MSKSQITHSAAQTQELAVHFAERILAKGPSKTALVLALSGDLGAGKTTFLQGFARALGIEEVVNSPTFVVMKSFKIQDQNFKKFYHIDCYRLETPEEILSLGFLDIIKDPANIVAIEWPEKIAKLLPRGLVKITFGHLKESEREITIDGL